VPFAWADVEAQVEGPRVAWFPHWDGAWRAKRAVTTIHDLIYLSEPGVVGAAKGAVARAWIARMVRASRALVTVSEYSAAQIRAAFPEAEGKLHVVPNGVSAAFFAPATADAAARDGAATDASVADASAADARPYLLTVGNKRPHKRFETAIRAFALLAGERPDLELRMVGNRDASTETLAALAASLGVAHRVRDIAALPDAELAAQYAGAEALLVTSREEGFGLIAIEAMAAGCPVIAVDRGPLREVVGDAGVLVPYDDADAIATAVRTLQEPNARGAHGAREPREARERLVAAGRARAARFTWERAAAALATVLVAAARE
jgi:glycosyltransferase involved in cell wall biosynthesis